VAQTEFGWAEREITVRVVEIHIPVKLDRKIKVFLK